MATSSQSSLRGKRVSVGVRPGVKKDDINRFLESIYDLNGCLGCGLGGFDLLFHGGGDPVIDKLNEKFGGQIGGISAGGF